MTARAMGCIAGAEHAVPATHAVRAAQHMPRTLSVSSHWPGPRTAMTLPPTWGTPTIWYSVITARAKPNGCSGQRPPPPASAAAEVPRCQLPPKGATVACGSQLRLCGMACYQPLTSAVCVGGWAQEDLEVGTRHGNEEDAWGAGQAATGRRQAS